MSKNTKQLDNSEQAAHRYIELLKQNPLVQAVWLGGSRSRNSPKNSHHNSDWDLQVITGTEITNLEIPDPAALGIYVDVFNRKVPSKYAELLWKR